MKQSVILFAAALAFAACSQDSEDRSQDSNIIQLSAAISGGDGVKAGTRAYDVTEANYQNTQFVDGKLIHVYAFDHPTAGEAATTPYTNANYTVSSTQGSATGSKLLNGTMYYSATGNPIDLLAFYPSTITNASTQDFPATGNITDQDVIGEYQNFDVMWADRKLSCTKGTGTGTVHSLTFHHAMAQIIVNVTADTDAGVSHNDVKTLLTAVKIKNTVPVATLTLNTATGEMAAAKKSTESVADIDIKGAFIDADNKFQSIGVIVPQTVNKGAEFIEITYAGNTYTYSLPNEASDANKEFEKGKKYVYSFRMQAAGIKLESLEITNWAADPNADGQGNSGSGDFTI